MIQIEDLEKRIAALEQRLTPAETHTEPLAPEGTKEWAWQQMLLGKDIIYENLPLFRRLNTFSPTEIRVSDAEGNVVEIIPFERFLEDGHCSGWQIYEPEPALQANGFGDYEPSPQPKVNVGDWATDGVVTGKVTSINDLNIANVKTHNAAYIINAENLEKVPRSEVKVSITLEGTVEQVLDGKKVFMLRYGDGLYDYYLIDFAHLTKPDRDLIKSLLDEMKEEK